MKKLSFRLATCTALMMAGMARAEGTDFKFFFGPGAAPTGTLQVRPNTMYNKETGYGFETFTAIPAPGTGPAVPPMAPELKEFARNSTAPPQTGLITSDKPFLFSVAVPPGNYRVTVTLGDVKEASTTTIKAESRMLMLEHVQTAPGTLVTASFTVNVHSPKLPEGGTVKLDSREMGVFHWDDKLTLEFMDSRPAVSMLEIHKVDDALTVFLCGDSTVTNQVREPYGTWGQMLPRWFNDRVAVADYAESGETVKAFRKEHRWEKVMSEVKKGDYVFLQFGHNDLNKTGHNAIWPSDDHDGDWANTYSEAGTDYKNLLKQYAAEAKAKGAIPVIVSPMTKIDIRTGELNTAGLRDYPPAAVAAAKEAGAACIDLNAMSVELVKALGPQGARGMYVEGLHSNSFGGYLLSRCIVEGIKENKLGLADFLGRDTDNFDPAHPRPAAEEFKVPLEPSGARGGRRGPASAPATGR